MYILIYEHAPIQGFLFCFLYCVGVPSLKLVQQQMTLALWNPSRCFCSGLFRNAMIAVAATIAMFAF